MALVEGEEAKQSEISEVTIVSIASILPFVTRETKYHSPEQFQVIYI